MFCDIVAGDASAKILDEGREYVAFEPINPFLSGHTLFVPRTHVEGPAESPALTGRITEQAVNYAKANAYSQFNVVMSEGRAATQTVRHLHVHLLPRWDDDDFYEGWPWHPSQVLGLG